MRLLTTEWDAKPGCLWLRSGPPGEGDESNLERLLSLDRAIEVRKADKSVEFTFGCGDSCSFLFIDRKTAVRFFDDVRKALTRQEGR